MSNIYITSRMEKIKRKYDKLRQKVILGHVLKKKKINKNHITKRKKGNIGGENKKCLENRLLSLYGTIVKE